MKPTYKKPLLYGFLSVFLLFSMAGSILAYRSYRAVSVAFDAQAHLRYLLESGESVGDVPASSAFASGYLEAVFGDNPELLSKLQNVIATGLQDSNKLVVNRVTAMMVTYRIDENDEVIDVATHIIGGPKSGMRKPGFHRDGYFKNLLERNIFNIGNTVIGCLGAEVIFFAEEQVEAFQQALIESLFTGEIELLVKTIEKPYFYTLVIPNPRRLLPPQLRHHVQTLIIKGNLQQMKGETEILALCSSEKSAEYTKEVLNDLKIAGEAILRTKFKGVIEEKPWGPTVINWWAHEMVMTSEKAILETEESILRVQTWYSRPMVNVILKSAERMGRDLAQMRGVEELRKDPRLVDWELRSPHPRHYWSAPHKWGPNWPIAPQLTAEEQAVLLDADKDLTDEPEPEISL